MTRWLRIVDVAVTKINTAVIADVIDKSEVVTAESATSSPVILVLIATCRQTKQ